MKTTNVKKVVIILDTLKKFVDLMDKGRSSNFTRVVRRFVLKGGSLIALAHTNKKTDSSGKPVYGGTSDIVDDCDCVFTLATVHSNDSAQKVVEFQNIKRRGNVCQNTAYKYSQIDQTSYANLLETVEQLNHDQLNSVKCAEAMHADIDVIKAIKACIFEGANVKMKLAEAAAEKAGVSKRVALNILEKYTGENEAFHQWKFVVKERGAKVFELLKGSTVQHDIDEDIY